MEKLEFIKSKIVSGVSLERILSYWRFTGKKIVFTNGCFDIIHRGHIEYLAKAADEGNVLVIGLNSDSSVRKLKGEGRPVNDEYSRALVLSSFSFVTNVVLFEEDTPYNLIDLIKPDVLVKGGDYKPEDIVGSNLVTSKGGRVVVIDFVDGFSTTGIIDKLNK